jgi:hypothetical protein
MSEIITGSPSSASARTVSARSAYFAFCVIILNLSTHTRGLIGSPTKIPYLYAHAGMNGI